jgi:asparagine synthase (glutamine-hydrolysing)
MCGIAGKLDFGAPVEPAVVERMCTAMRHRGPNARGLHVGDGVVLGMQRLAIIDVAGGDQPIYNEDRSVAVVLNGEIYNFQALRDELLARGHRLQTRSDTEALVHLYEDHGPDLVQQLHGMFAFAIWDTRRRRLVLGRDRVGKKPLFWARRGETFWFASELWALLQDPELPRRVDPRAIGAYLALGYVPHPRSALEGIHKLPPATTLVADAEGQRIQPYWRLDYRRKLKPDSEQQLAEELWEHIQRATRRRLVSEVPLGAFLSGGIDSSAVVAAMAQAMAEPVKTFSIGFPHADYDELPYARMIAERYGTDHHEFQVEPRAVDIMPLLARHYGEPYADASAIPSFYLAEMTGHHVTVALNGDGGDESFAGYQRYGTNYMMGRLDFLPRAVRAVAGGVAGLSPDGPSSRSWRSRIHRLAPTLPMGGDERYAFWFSAFNRVWWNRLLTPEFRAHVGDSTGEDVLRGAWARASVDNDLDRMLAVDVEVYLPDDLLVKIDIASMAHSLEARSPLLDHELMEWAAALPPGYKQRNRQGKVLLKRALRGRIPDVILDRPKQGFGVPLAEWFRDELRDLPGERLLDPTSLSRVWFRSEVIEQLIKEHQLAKADHSFRLWVLLQLETWHAEVFRASPLAAGHR